MNNEQDRASELEALAVRCGRAVVYAAAIWASALSLAGFFWVATGEMRLRAIPLLLAPMFVTACTALRSLARSSQP